MQEITQSSWFLLLTIITTFLTLITGTIAIFKYFISSSPSLSKTKKNDNKVNQSTDLVFTKNKSFKLPPTQNRKKKSIFKFFAFKPDSTEQEKVESEAMQFSAYLGIVVGSIIAIGLGITHNWNYVEYIKGIFLFGIGGLMIGGFFITFIFFSSYSKQSQHYLRKKDLEPLRLQVLRDPTSVHNKILYGHELYYASSNRNYSSYKTGKRLLAEAFIQANEALKISPNNPSALSLYASILIKLKRYDDARKALEHILQLESDGKFGSITTTQNLAKQQLRQIAED